MRRAASVPGAVLVTLALAGSPAWASTPTQSTEDSTGAAQAGQVDVDAPVRVVSDGDNEGAAQKGSAGEQSTTDSELTAQVGPVDVDAPVRVVSDGDNEGAAHAKGGSQSIDDSTGAAQVGPIGVNAPVRVLSDGDNEGAAQKGSAGEQSTTDSELTAQVGPVDVDAPVRVVSDGDNDAGGAGGNGGGGPPPTNGDGGSPPADTPDEGPTVEPLEPTEDGIEGVKPRDGEDDMASSTRLTSVSTRGAGGPATAAPSADRDELPFTGLTVWLLLVIGAWLLGTGLCLQRLLGRQGIRGQSLSATG